MINREYYPLNIAENLISCTEEDLKHFAANKRIKIYCLTDECCHARCRDENIALPKLIEVHFRFWLEIEAGFKPYPARIIIPSSEGVIDCSSEIYDLSDSVVPYKFVVLHADLIALREKQNESNLSNADIKPLESSNYISHMLATLNRAAYEFWSDVEPSEMEIHPTNEEVHNWLKKQGFSEISAKQGAVIIRPEWAALGRRPAK